MNDIQFDSIFVTNLKVGTSAYITELLLNNKIQWLINKGQHKDKPKCAFWRKDIATQHPQFKALQEDYIREISYVKNLLRCFSGKIVMSYVKERNLITFRLLTLDKQKTVIYNLYKEECKYQKDLKKLVKATKMATQTTEVQKRKTNKSNLTGLI